VTGGATRGYSLARGSNVATFEYWHRWGGPTPPMEFSDDGRAVAVVASRFAGTPTYSAPTTTWPSAREDVIAYRTTDHVQWREVPVTGDGSSVNVFSAAGGAIWRFGCLAFTKDGKGLVFWGGFSCWHAAGTSSTVQYSSLQGGTLYGADLSTATSHSDVRVTSLLDAAEGGSADGVRTYSTTSPYAPTLPALAYSSVAGVVKPYGGFLSRNREFLYLCNKGGVATASADYRLVGVNVRSTDPTASVNGHPDFRAFAVGGWPSRRGFLSGTYQHYPYYGLYFTDYPAYRKWGAGLQVVARDAGWVFWASHHQSVGPAVGTASALYGGPLRSTYSYDYASLGGEVEGFEADVGGQVERLSSFGSDGAVRRIHFLAPRASGDAVAFVLDTYGTSNASPSHESLHVVRSVAFAGAGGLAATPWRASVEHGPERIGDAVAFGSEGDRLYYGAGEASDENVQTLREARFTAAGVIVRTLSAAPRRWNVLFAGR
jgi:hypothetical protein